MGNKSGQPIGIVLWPMMWFYVCYNSTDKPWPEPCALINNQYKWHMNDNATALLTIITEHTRRKQTNGLFD